MSKRKAPAAPAKAAKPAKKPVTPVGRAATRPGTAKAASKPAAKPGVKAAAKPATKAPTKPVAKPTVRAAASSAKPKPVAKAAAKPAAKVAPKAAAKAAPKAPVKPKAPATGAKTEPARKAPAKPKASTTTARAKAAPSPKVPTIPTPKTSAVPAAPAAPKAVTQPTPPKPVAKPAASAPARKSSLKNSAPVQPVPAAPIHPANRFADRFAPAKPSARYLPEPMVETKPAAKPDPKLANAWKTKAGRDLSEAELLAMPDSEYMNDKQVDFFRARLNALKEDLLSNAGETTEHLREDTTIVPDPADRATIEEEHALELRTRDRERKLLRKISQSLARIDAGEYGYCEETGEPIGLGRLLARPTATLSLEAQQRRELKQRMFGD